LETNPYLSPEAASGIDVPVEEPSREDDEVPFSIVLHLCLLLIIVVAVFVQAPLPFALLLFGLPPTIPLWISLRQIYYWKSAAARSLMNLGSVAYTAFFGYVYCQCFYESNDPTAVVALDYVPLIGTPLMMVVWLAAGIANRR
jgi:hypothetical protein